MNFDTVTVRSDDRWKQSTSAQNDIPSADSDKSTQLEIIHTATESIHRDNKMLVDGSIQALS